MSYSDYKLEQTACDTALKRTIAACMIGVSEVNLIDYSVIDASAIRAPSNSAAEASKPTSPSPTSSLLRNNIANGLRRMLFAPRQLTPTGRIQITYSIHVYNASLSYQQLTNQLSEAVSNSTFNTLLRQNAQSLGTAVFAAAVATDVTTTDLGGIDEGSGSSGGGGGVDLGMELVDFITFIVVFGAMILMVLFGIFLCKFIWLFSHNSGIPSCSLYIV